MNINRLKLFLALLHSNEEEQTSLFSCTVVRKSRALSCTVVRRSRELSCTAERKNRALSYTVVGKSRAISEMCHRRVIASAWKKQSREG